MSDNNQNLKKPAEQGGQVDAIVRREIRCDVCNKFPSEHKAIEDHETKPKIKLNENDVKDYLDKCIMFWRNKRDAENCEYAKYYIDAFQSVRTSFFDELLSA